MQIARKTTTFALVMGIFALAMGLLLVLSRVATAQDTSSADDVEPIVEDGNTTCATLNANKENNLAYDVITSDFGFKIDANPTGGTYTFINSTQNGDATLLTGGAPADSSNSVTLTPTAFESGPGSDTTMFEWMSTLGIDAVIVKARDSNVYVYTPEDFADGDLQAPELKGISHVEFCYDYNLTASKTAKAKFTSTYAWTIDKSVTPATHSGFAGQPFSSDYEVVVDQTVTDSDFAVDGSITVTNPSPLSVTANVADVVNGNAATVDCGGGSTSLTLAAGATGTCTYSASLDAKEDGTNTATITSKTSGVSDATASANYAFTEPTTVIGDSTVNVTDSVQGPLGSASGDQTFKYSRNFPCSSEPADYDTNGFDSDTYPNTATIKGDNTNKSDDASVKVDCYAPLVSKDASTEWKQKYDWTIIKTASPTTHTGLSGDSFTSNYEVVVDQIVTDGGFKAFGTISVSNPVGAPGSMTVDVADAIGSNVATVDCGGSASLTVAAGATGTCTYTVDLPDNTDTTNTATVTLNKVNFPATAPVDFGDPIIEGDPKVDVSDTYNGGPSGEVSGDQTFKYSRNFPCSSNPGDYTNGSDSDTYDNKATISGPNTDKSDDASVKVDCTLKGSVTVLKTTDKKVDPTKSIDFTLTGPGLPSGGVTKNTFGDSDGILDFGYSLVPGQQYTVCENPVPAGFTSFWKLDGTIVTPYNPGASKSPPEDLGVRCYDFKASAGQKLGFEIDNSHPGGDPRTIGYWKNWNKCTSGNQAATAAKNGGSAAGVFIVEDLLPQTLSTGDSNISDDYKVTTCAQAVKILSKQNQSGKNMASDAAYELASQLLAAKFNLAAGAETCSGVQTAVTNGQLLLDQINFNGSGSYLAKTSTNRTKALSLAATLDKYNNGNVC